jgi:hypothetical protein
VGAEDYLIRSGERKVTAHEFLQALELVKTAHPDGLAPGSRELAEVRADLLEDMATELVLLNRAEELGVAVSDHDLEAAVAAISADYPPGVFEQTLLESSVNLDSWKNRLRVRLVLEKVVEADLREFGGITTEEVSAHYDRHYGGRAAAAGSEEEFERLRESIVADLRRQKIEDAYADWIRRFKDRFPVTVNPEVWDRLQASPEGP